MAKVYLSLGTNLGNKEQNLLTAIEHINKRVGKVISSSAFYKTEPWGFNSTHVFLNAAVEVETNLPPINLLKETQLIEKEMGRTAKSKGKQYSDRLIDIDILLYDNLILNTAELVLPHPLMTQRAFVMEPLVEIAPELVHPVLLKRMREVE